LQPVRRIPSTCAPRVEDSQHLYYSTFLSFPSPELHRLSGNLDWQGLAPCMTIAIVRVAGSLFTDMLRAYRLLCNRLDSHQPLATHTSTHSATVPIIILHEIGTLSIFYSDYFALSYSKRDKALRMRLTK